MVLDLKQPQISLYDTDYNLWLEETVKQLQAQDFDAIDWKNLIEEIASLGRSEKRRIESLLTRLFEHLLKLAYWRLRSSTRRVSTPRPKGYRFAYRLQAFTQLRVLGKGTREVKRKETIIKTIGRERFVIFVNKSRRN